MVVPKRGRERVEEREDGVRKVGESRWEELGSVRSCGVMGGLLECDVEGSLGISSVSPLAT